MTNSGPRITPAAVSNVLIAAGVIAIAIAIGALVSAWVGVLAAGVEAVVLGVLIALALPDESASLVEPVPVPDALADDEPLFPAAA